MIPTNQSNNRSEAGVNRSLCSMDSSTVLHIRMVVYVVTLIAAIVINSFVIVIVYKSRRLRSPINYLIVNLALADLLAPSFAVPRIIAIIYDPSWAVKGPFGDFLCKLSSFVMEVPTAVSIQTLVIMTADRFHAIVFPMRSALLSTRRCVIAIAITWLLAFLLYSPNLYIWRLMIWPPTGIEFCSSSWEPAFDTETADKIYYWVVLIIHTAIPLIILITLHTLIMTSLKRHDYLQAGTQNRKRKTQRKPTDLEDVNLDISYLFNQLGPLQHPRIYFVSVWRPFPALFFPLLPFGRLPSVLFLLGRQSLRLLHLHRQIPRSFQKTFQQW